ncbi:hypothetical protein [Nesterenkonia flava]|nr:hypothetical protein [Nesterenkonia flava]
MDAQDQTASRGEFVLKCPYRLMAVIALTGLLAFWLIPLAQAAEPAESEDGSVDEAGQGLQLSGERVTGGSNAGDAHPLSPGAAYLDTLSSGTLYYRIPKEHEGSALHVSVAFGEQREEPDYMGADVQLSTWESTRCASGSVSTAEMNTRDRLGSTYLIAGPEPETLLEPEQETDPDAEPAEDPCGEAGELVLSISPFDPESGLIGEDFEIAVFEEPSPINAQDFDAEAPEYDHHWTDMGRNVSGAQPVSPGASFDDAPALDPGTTYDSSISPGEVQVFRVPVEWNERLQAEAFFPEPGDSLSEELSGMGSVSLAAFSPMRGMAHGDFSTVSTSSATELRTHTSPVWWNSRFARGGNSTALAGDFYLVMAADPHDDGDSPEIPYRLTLQTYEEDGAPTPEYPEGTTSTPQIAGAEQPGNGDSTSEDEEASADGEEPTAVERLRSIGDSPGILISLGAFGLLLMAAGGLFLARTMRRH